MQDLDAPSGVAIGIPKIGLPIKGIAIVLGMLVLSFIGIYFITRFNAPQPYDDSAVWGAIDSVNKTVTSRQYIDSNFNSLGSRLDQVTTQFTGMKNDIISIKNDLKALKSANASNPDYSAKLANISSRLGNVETTLSKLGNMSWISGFPIANSSTPTHYLCDVAGVPAELKFQYTYSCICDLRKTYGPYLNAGAACMVNRDQKACSCYYLICDANAGLC